MLNIGTDELSKQKQSFNNENQQEKGGGSTTLEHNSLIEANVSNEIPQTAKEYTEGASNCPVRLLVVVKCLHENLLLGYFSYLVCVSEINNL
ncbi:hypothetical protein MTR67_051255 [Solanum verrucosum]|uniref:Uncharacterized protein n=1 Tax=Solanum verrucosum TaxID=315347 RepID=A0AAF0V4T0_SOLVR|nr:hypothetical protein MTR67_051255 [Solanum verrucosum]